MDIAEKIGSLEDCLYSTGNRVEIAKMLLNLGRTDLLATVLEDLYYGTQLILDEYCVVKE